ncbi:uncharacterized protein LAESUDRAFT_731032 [Laetiporus sulphureus 93-53]|uniref:G domain-containing protein n=1 Tax=Laetiporus sulphureus 93-53 TaxID=1314785 RepID=A0A165BTH3_9APHY|nr:uncharacterized protein LAESUDRAFT_731032 [Laetiporus sulphureus 93-53]KZT01619.1 hypothetical protein LAESUDRAFT_731032 [Laetiporus sulphureus 93-53]
MSQNASTSIDDLSSSSTLIAVTGPTGVGKTAFINSLCNTTLQVSKQLESCTDKIQVAHCSFNDINIALIDTPGFDDTYKSHVATFEVIAEFLEKLSRKGIKLTGLLYMHRISDVRVGGTARHSFRVFTKICGADALKNVTIVTTMWEDVKEDVGEGRERELAEKPIFFKDAIDGGAEMMRYYNNIGSAQRLMEAVLKRSPVELQIQRELVIEGKTLPQTAAGVELQTELERQVHDRLTEVEELRRHLAELKTTGLSDQTVQGMERELEEAWERVTAIQGEIQQLRSLAARTLPHAGGRELAQAATDAHTAQRSFWRPNHNNPLRHIARLVKGLKQIQISLTSLKDRIMRKRAAHAGGDKLSLWQRLRRATS